MRSSRLLRFSVLLALGVTAAAMFVAAAGAEPERVFRATFHDEGTETIEDFCGVEGLTVERAFVEDVRIMAAPHGPDGLIYFQFHPSVTEVFTNSDGDFVTSVAASVDKDLRVTDNGDGTLTILVLATGPATLYGEDGKAIARNPGQVRYELDVDHGGTPTDPSDDVELDFRVVKESTGRSDDFCAAMVAALS